MTVIADGGKLQVTRLLPHVATASFDLSHWITCEDPKARSSAAAARTHPPLRSRFLPCTSPTIFLVNIPDAQVKEKSKEKQASLHGMSLTSYIHISRVSLFFFNLVVRAWTTEFTSCSLRSSVSRSKSSSYLDSTEQQPPPGFDSFLPPLDIPYELFHSTVRKLGSVGSW